MNDFIRPMTEHEFDDKFKHSGVEELARQFCEEEMMRWFDDILKEEVDQSSSLNDNRIRLGKYRKTNIDTVRDAAWADMLSLSEIDAYVSQRKIGHNHVWSKIYAENYIENYPYQSTYDELYNTDSELAKSELEILIIYLSKAKESVFEKYLRNRLLRDSYDTIDEAIKKTEEFYVEYCDLKGQGHNHDYSYMLAELRLNDDYNDLYRRCFAEVYSCEKALGLTHHAAYMKAEKEAEIIFDKLSDRGWSLEQCRIFAKRYVRLIDAGESEYNANKKAYEEAFR